MCLITDSNIPSCCSEEIICYKIIRVIEGKYKALFNGDYEYPEIKEGTTITDSKKAAIIKLGDTYVIDEGFYHAFTNPVKAKIMMDTILYMEGVSGSPLELWKCVIPVSSLYFRGTKKKDICSKSLKFIKRIKRE